MTIPASAYRGSGNTALERVASISAPDCYLMRTCLSKQSNHWEQKTWSVPGRLVGKRECYLWVMLSPFPSRNPSKEKIRELWAYFLYVSEQQRYLLKLKKLAFSNLLHKFFIFCLRLIEATIKRRLRSCTLDLVASLFAPRTRRTRGSSPGAVAEFSGSPGIATWTLVNSATSWGWC